MSPNKTTILTAGALVLGLTLRVWAGGSLAGGGAASCLVSSPAGGSVALRGTAVVTAQNVNEGAQTATDVDLTMRLERGGAVVSVRMNIPPSDPDPNIWGKTNEEIACRFLENADVKQAILAALAPSKTTLKITTKSITNAQLGPIPGTTASSTIADITVYAQ